MAAPDEKDLDFGDFTAQTLSLGGADSSAAIGELKAAAAADSGNATKHFQLAQAYVAQGSFDEAFESFDAAIKIDGANIAFLRGKAQAQIACGESDAAVATLEGALKASPNDAGALTDLGRAHLEEGDQAEALAAFNKAIAADAKSSEALFQLATLESKNPDESLAKLRQVIAIDNTHVRAHKAAGTILQTKGGADCKEAATLFARAVELDASDEQTRARLAQCYDASGQDAERDAAREALHKAFQAGTLRAAYAQVGRFCCAQWETKDNFVMAFDYSKPAGDTEVQFMFQVYPKGKVHDDEIIFTASVEKSGGNYVLNKKLKDGTTTTEETYGAAAPDFSALKAKVTTLA